jgi:isoleucyl-tRNA synthetase
MNEGEIDVEEDGCGAWHRLNYRMRVLVVLMSDWKDTLNLPRTEFPMKANLPATEPATIARWESMGLYSKLRESRRNATRFRAARWAALRQRPDPPRPRPQQDPEGSRRQVAVMAGFDAPYVPGWDCHGLPIELNVEKEKHAPDKDKSPVEFRRRCRAYADKFVDSQRQDFKRSASSATGRIPYLTMNPAFRRPSSGRSAGLSIGAWSTKAKSPSTGACGIARRWRKPEGRIRGSQVTVDLRGIPAFSERRRRPWRSRPALAGRDVTVLIWTTTPWTIPANLAIAFHPDFDYGAYEVEGRAVIVATELAAKVSEVTGRRLGAKVATFKGRRARPHPVQASFLRTRLPGRGW